MADHSEYSVAPEDNSAVHAAGGDPNAFDEGESSELGAITIHHGVIAVIARIAALKVPGVVEMSGSFTDGLAGLIGKSSSDRGIRVEADAQGVSLDLHVVIEYGVKIPPAAWQVQSEVRRSVEELTGKRVKAVNVIIQGVRSPGGAGLEKGGEA